MTQLTNSELADPNVSRQAKQCEHVYRTWRWSAYMMPTSPPQPLVGWWAICTRCHLGYKYDAQHVRRKWWQLFRWYRAPAKG
jgi:hypothetical protein